MRYRMPALIAALTILPCVGCTEDESPRGAVAMKESCEGILDETAVKEAAKKDKFERIYEVTAPEESHAAAAEAVSAEDHAAYVCRLAFADAADTSDDALWLRFTPNLSRLFPEGENRSRGYFKAYKLNSGMQAAIRSTSTDIYFFCDRKDQRTPFSVTGTLYNDLNLSTKTRFAVIFRSAVKLIHSLKCTNEIKFPSPNTMKPLPDGN